MVLKETSRPSISSQQPNLFAELTLLLLLVVSPAIASARVARTTIQVSAHVVNECAAKIPSSLELPAYRGVQVRSVAQLEIKCTNGASPVISLNSAATWDGAARALTGPSGKLAYQIFSDDSYKNVWVSLTGSLADGVTFAPYGLHFMIPSGQQASPGTYNSRLDVMIDSGDSTIRHWTIWISTDVH